MFHPPDDLTNLLNQIAEKAVVVRDVILFL